MSVSATMNTVSGEQVVLPGLREPVEITVDRWGIPHIRAGNLRDLFFAQGFNAARDRLWQIDLARKRGLGRLSANFGAGYLEQDRATRLFLYRGDMAAEWLCYGEDAEAICTAFAAGINAFVDLAEAEPDRLPPEYSATGTRPERWEAADVVRIRTHAWVRNALSEVVRAKVMSTGGPDVDLMRQRLDPAVMPHVADGLDLASIPLDLLDAYKLAIAPVSFSPARADATIAEAGRWIKIAATGEVVADATMQGSNNWVVHGSHTASGRPILANDPHRAHAVPALRYLVHLTAPEFNAIGTGEPVLPGIMLGHNGHSAFGLTLFFGPDVEDVYVYELDPDDPERYRYEGGWERMRIVEETVQVRGGPDQLVRLKFTRHGPVVLEAPDQGRAYAIRTVMTETGAAPYAASLISMRTRSFEAFRAAQRHWAVPAVNHVYADASGDVGWVTAGHSPIRGNWDGLLPVPGDGRYEWKGFLDPDDMPWIKNPPAGFFASANEMNVPASWPTRPEQIGFEWWEPSRANRLQEVLSSRADHAVEGSMALQTDTLSRPAIRLQRLLAGLGVSDPGSVDALACIASWDCRLEAGSAAAALFELWWSMHLKPALFDRVMPDAGTRALLMAPGDVESILRALEQPSFGEARRDDMLLATLRAAWADASRRLGPVPAQWAWGNLHQGYFTHALAPLLPAEQATETTVGPLPKGGGDSTTMMAAYRPTDFRVHLGASVRIVVDVGDWDKSVCINAPGQSGDPRSPHYADLAPLWAKGEYVPMLYSAAAIDAVAERRIALLPG